MEKFNSNNLNKSIISNKVIKICIIGAGRAGNFHVNSLSTNKNYELLYIIDQDLKKAAELAQKANCLSHNDTDYILYNVNIDAVIICTTTSTHYDLTMKCLKANKHVFCEKPLGNNENEIHNCFNLANSLNLKLLVAYQKRFDKNYNKLYNIINNNNYKPKNIHIVNKDYPVPPSSYLKTSNGIVEDMICHDIDIINCYMNFEIPEKLITFTHTNDSTLKELNEIEVIEIMMQYKNGQIVTFSASRVSQNGYDQRVEIHGDFGMLTLNNQLDDTIVKYDTNGSHTSKINYSFGNRYKEAYIKELEHFYNIIISNEKPIIQENHLVLTKKICNAINKSIKENCMIYLEECTKLRNYKSNESNESNEINKQYELYKDMHTFQTLEFVKNKKQQYSKLNNCKMTMKEALEKLNSFVDQSDPDLDEENIIHAYQTAERIRILHPLNKELQIVGLIHDVGKVLYTFDEPNWAVVGDTYVVGCKYSESIVYYETLKLNPDYSKYDQNGIYESGCGIDNLHLSFGHDEYLYQVLVQNNIDKISKQNKDIIRYHSFYPWHTNGDYKHLMSKEDEQTLENIKYFNNFDLYSKEDKNFVLTHEIKKYYDNLLEEYFPDILQW
jgi:inositol oxygenase